MYTSVILDIEKSKSCHGLDHIDREIWILFIDNHSIP